MGCSTPPRRARGRTAARPRPRIAYPNRDCSGGTLMRHGASAVVRTVVPLTLGNRGQSSLAQAEGDAIKARSGTHCIPEEHGRPLGEPPQMILVPTRSRRNPQPPRKFPPDKLDLEKILDGWPPPSTLPAKRISNPGPVLPLRDVPSGCTFPSPEKLRGGLREGTHGKPSRRLGGQQRPKYPQHWDTDSFRARSVSHPTLHTHN